MQAGLMFVIELIYKTNLGAIDAHMAAHMKFLKKVPHVRTLPCIGEERTSRWRDHPGGWGDRTEIEAIAREDPFYIHGLADIDGASSSAQVSALTTSRPESTPADHAPTRT